MGKGSNARSGHNLHTYAGNYDDIFRKKEDTHEKTEQQEEIIKSVYEDLTSIAYTTYCKEVGGVAFNGDELPDWEEFGSDPDKTKQANAWRESVKAVVVQFDG
tara:strand:+ start:3358 stop:3666 length:309 start_codon:yes stop_codon:yes gene_type:complete